MESWINYLDYQKNQSEGQFISISKKAHTKFIQEGDLAKLVEQSMKVAEPVDAKHGS